MRAIFDKRHRAPLLILLALALAYWGKVLFTGQVLLPGAFLRGFAPFGADPQAPWTILYWDALGQYYPWRAFAARQLAAGQIPLWNDFQFCGTPFLANGQSAVFYPLNLPFWLMDTAYAFGVSAFLHTLLAAFGTYFLAQRWQMSRAASLLSAIGFGFCGYLAAWIMLPTVANTAAWLPLLMWSAECAVRSRNSTFPIPHSALLSCALLAGHPQIFFFVLLSLGLHALFQPQRIRAFAQLIGGAAFAGAVGAIQLLPMLELARLGHRAGGGPTTEGWQGIAERGLSFGELQALIVPGVEMRWGTLNENFGYAGIGLCLLALGAMVLWKQPKGVPLQPKFFALALTIMGLLYALATPLPQAFYWAVPGLSQMSGVGRALFLWNLGIALLAGFGLDALRRKIASPLLPAVALLLVGAELFGFGLITQPTAPRAVIYPETNVTRFLQTNLKTDERVWFLTPRGGWLRTEELSQFRRNHPPGVLPPNGAMVYGLHDINGYDSLAPRAYREWLAQFTDKISPQLNGNMILLEELPAAALDAMNVRFVVVTENSPRSETNEREILRADSCIVYERKIGAAKRIAGADFYPGWKDGKYQPETFRFGAFVTMCALAVIGGRWSARSGSRKTNFSREASL